MKDSLLIKTKLRRMILLLLVFGACAISLTVINRDLGGTLVMVVGLFYFLYILNRRVVVSVEADREKVTFEYQERKTKKLTVDYKDLLFKQSKVKSMLGETNIIEIFSASTNERLFGISQKLFKKKADYKAFVDFFGIQ